MREILFRGKRVDGQWVIGDLFRNRGETFIAPDGIQSPSATADDFKVDPETVGQYTGLKDKHGVKIFEGDIVKWVSSDNQVMIDSVKWLGSGLCLRNSANTVGSYKSYHEVEVIGNIHDHKSLLEDKNG